MNPIVIYIVVAFLVVLVIAVYLYFFLVVYSAFTNCEKSESPYCPLMYCNDPTTACGNYPWRPDPVTGNPICAKYLLTQSAPTASAKTV